MNRILIVNPNRSTSITERILRVASRYLQPGTSLDAVTAAEGPAYVETRRDEVLAAHAVLKTLDRLGTEPSYHAFIIACFSDPGLLAARESMPAPVLGLGEATLLLAHGLGVPYSLLTNVPADEEPLREMARSYHLDARLVSLRPAGFPIEAFDREEPAAGEGLRRAAKAAVEEDGARALCLACAAMAGWDHLLARELGVPVLDGVACAVTLAQIYLALGLNPGRAPGAG